MTQESCCLGIETEVRQLSTGNDTSKASDTTPSTFMGSVLLRPILRIFYLSASCFGGYDGSKNRNSQPFKARYRRVAPSWANVATPSTHRSTVKHVMKASAHLRARPECSLTPLIKKDE